MTQGPPPEPPRVNGTAKQSAAEARPSHALRQVCEDLRRTVTAFLDAAVGDDALLRGTQEQVRVSMGVIDEALARYGYVRGPPTEPAGLGDRHGQGLTACRAGTHDG
jgi:FAD synthetase